MITETKSLSPGPFWLAMQTEMQQHVLRLEGDGWNVLGVTKERLVSSGGRGERQVRLCVSEGWPGARGCSWENWPFWSEITDLDPPDAFKKPAGAMVPLEHGV